MSIISSDSSKTFSSRVSDEVRFLDDEDEFREEVNINIKTLTFKLYRRRYYMLALFSFLHIFNQVGWLSTSAIEEEISKAYGINDYRVDLIPTLYLIMYIPGMILSTAVYSKYNLRAGVVTGAILQAIGSGLKGLVNIHFEFVFAGQILGGIANAFIMTAPAMLATQWFENEKRAIAITIGANANNIGMAIGMVLPTIFVRQVDKTDADSLKTQIFLSNITQASIVGLLAVLALFTFKNRPPTPPSKVAVVPREERLFHKYLELAKNIEFQKLGISFGIGYANIIVLFEMIETIIEPFNFNDDDAGVFAITNVLGGIIGAFVVGYWLDKSKSFKTVNLIITIGSTLSIIAFLGSLFSELNWLVAAAFGLFGFGCFPIIVLTYEYASVMTHPTKESTSSAVFILYSQVLSIALIYLIDLAKNQISGRLGVTVGISVLIVFNIIGVTSSMLIKHLGHGRIEKKQDILSNSYIIKMSRKYKFSSQL